MAEALRKVIVKDGNWEPTLASCWSDAGCCLSGTDIHSTQQLLLRKHCIGYRCGLLLHEVLLLLEWRVVDLLWPLLRRQLLLLLLLLLFLLLLHVLGLL